MEFVCAILKIQLRLKIIFRMVSFVSLQKSTSSDSKDLSKDGCAV